jgi:hypothetical protein
MGLTCSLLWRAGVPAMRALAPCWLAAAAMLASAPGHGADDLPPPLPAEAGSAQPGPGASAGEPAAAPAEAQPATSASAPRAEPAPPSAAEASAKAARPERDAKIEQKHVGRRVSELIVTPAGFTFHYTMIHLDDQDRGTSPLQPHTELSVPRFFRIDF